MTKTKAFFGLSLQRNEQLQKVKNVSFDKILIEKKRVFLFYQLKMLLDVDVIKNYNDIFGVSLLFISPKRIEWYTGFNQGQV